MTSCHWAFKPYVEQKQMEAAFKVRRSKKQVTHVFIHACKPFAQADYDLCMVAGCERGKLPNLMKQHVGKQALGRRLLLAAALSTLLLVFVCQQWLAGSLPWQSQSLVPSVPSSSARDATKDTTEQRPQALSRLFQHVVYLPDLHGDLKQAQTTLRMLNLTDEEGKWVGGTTVLVQGGDLVDRGPQSLPLLQFFHNLSVSAAAVGGSVVNLLGNHELMLLQSDLRYFNADETLGLGGGRHSKPHINVIRRQEGEKKLLQLLRPQGWVGRLLRRRPLAYVSSGMAPACDLLFIHAGAFPWMVETAQHMQSSNSQVAGRANTDAAAATLVTGSAAAGSVAAGMSAAADAARSATGGDPPTPLHEIWNQAVATELLTCIGSQCGREGAFAGKLLGAEGGVWSRYYTTMSDAQVCEAVAHVTSALQVSRIVVGHTIQESMQGRKPSVLCDGRLIMADIGMSQAYGGEIGRYAAVQCGPVRRGGSDGETEVAVSVEHGQGVARPPIVRVLEPPPASSAAQ